MDRGEEKRLMSDPQKMDVEKIFKEVAERRGMTATQYGDALMVHKFKDFDYHEIQHFSGEIYRTGLDPLAGHLDFLKFGGKRTASITIDGWYTLAQKSGIGTIKTSYETLDCGDIACTATVSFKSDPSGVFERTEFLSENAAQGGPTWKKMPKRMLGHRAIISALRAACGTVSLPSSEELLEVGFEEVGKQAPEAPTFKIGK